MAALAVEASHADAKMILVGDPKQLPAVEAGGLFAALATRVPVVELKQNRRQQDPQERLITAALRAGRTELAVRCLDERGRITIAHNSDTLRDQMVLDWWEHRSAGRGVLIGAVHRSDVRDLNARAHAVLEADARVGPVVAVVDDQRFCVGDQILALKNRYDLGIVNGELAEITGADQRGIHARCDDGRQIHLPLDYVSEHVTHAYARTVHKAQGLTCDVALLLGDDGLYAELGYTGLTRATQENHVYTVVTTAEFDGDGYELADLVRTLDTSRAKTAAIDYLDALEIA